MSDTRDRSGCTADGRGGRTPEGAPRPAGLGRLLLRPCRSVSRPSPGLELVGTRGRLSARAGRHFGVNPGSTRERGFRT
jgi:hypothetical protein